MSSENPIAIIELGDINIKCVIFKINNNRNSEILSTAMTISEGIHNDIVVNLYQIHQLTFLHCCPGLHPRQIPHQGLL